MVVERVFASSRFEMVRAAVVPTYLHRCRTGERGVVSREQVAGSSAVISASAPPKSSRVAACMANGVLCVECL